MQGTDNTGVQAKWVRYFVRRDEDGPSMLARVHKDETGIWGEFYGEDGWEESHSVTNFIVMPDDAAEEIDAEEAAAIERAWDAERLKRG